MRRNWPFLRDRRIDAYGGDRPQVHRLTRDDPRRLASGCPPSGRPHEATWIAWPHKPSDWPGKFAPIPWVYAEIVRQLTPRRARSHPGGRRSREDEARQTSASAPAVDLEQVRVLPLPHRPRLDPRHRARSSCATTAPGRPAASRASASTPGRSTRTGRRTTAFPTGPPRRWAEARAPRSHEARKVVLEGGTIDVNGRGTAAHHRGVPARARIQVRNPGFDRARLRGGASPSHLGAPQRPLARPGHRRRRHPRPRRRPLPLRDPRTVVLVPRDERGATRTTAPARRTGERLRACASRTARASRW